MLKVAADRAGGFRSRPVLPAFLRAKAVGHLFDGYDPEEVRRAVPDSVLDFVERRVGLACDGGGAAAERGAAALGPGLRVFYSGKTPWGSLGNVSSLSTFVLNWNMPGQFPGNRDYLGSPWMSGECSRVFKNAWAFQGEPSMTHPGNYNCGGGGRLVTCTPELPPLHELPWSAKVVPS